MVAIMISDDGKGLPPEVFRAAQEPGESLVDLLTSPGFSTAGEVSGLSGRGVGLHVVKTVVESFGGSMTIESQPGLGTTTTLLLPLTLALLDVLLLERGGQVFGVPLAVIEEVIVVDQTLSLAGRPSVERHGQSLPLFDLADIVGATPGDAAAATRTRADHRRLRAPYRGDVRSPDRGRGGRGQEPRPAARPGSRLPRRVDPRRRTDRAAPRPRHARARSGGEAGRGEDHPLR